MYTLEFFNNKTNTEKKIVAATKLLDIGNLTVKQPIFTTKDYSLFSFKDENRKIIPGHVKVLKDSTQKYGQQDLIKVNPNGVIQDGQHKFTALKLQNLPIDFYIVEDSHVNIIALNTHRRNWQLHDYLNYYVQNNEMMYVRFNKVWEEFPMFSVPGIAKSVSAKNVAFKAGDLNITTFNMIDGVNILRGCKGMDWFTQYSSTGFVAAIARANRLYKQFDIKIFFEKCEMYKSSKIHKCSSFDEYTSMVISLWNFKSRNKIKS